MNALMKIKRLFAPMNTEFALPVAASRLPGMSGEHLRERIERRSPPHLAAAALAFERRLASARLDRRGNFLPSVQLARLVADGLAKELTERSHFQRDPSDGVPGNAELREFVGEKLCDLLASMGRGVARGGTAAFPLTEQGQLLDVVWLGLRRRIPLNRVDEVNFSAVLVRDLAQCVGQGFRVGSYARVVLLPDGALALEALPAPPQQAPVEWTRASVYEL